MKTQATQGNHISKCSINDKGHAKKCLIAKKNHLPNAQIQVSLKDEICQLERRLQHQVCVRSAFEQALGNRSSSDIPNLSASIPKPAIELIREIAVLEYGVSHLEQYLLSLYRKAFDQQISCPSPLRNDKTLKPTLITPRGKYLETCRADISLKANTSGCFHSSVTRASPAEILGKSLHACHSQPPSMMEYANTSSNIISLAEHLGTKNNQSCSCDTKQAFRRYGQMHVGYKFPGVSDFVAVEFSFVDSDVSGFSISF